MARIRTIKPEFWTDPLMVSLPYEVRLFYIGLWNFADDWGCLEDEPLRLKLQVLPADPVDADALVRTLIDNGRLERMKDESGAIFLHLTKFEDHQKLDKRSASRYGLAESWVKVASDLRPPNPAESRRIPPNPAESRQLPPNPPQLTPDPPDSHRIPPLERKGKERKVIIGAENFRAENSGEVPEDADAPDEAASAPIPRKPRPPDELFDAIVEETGRNLGAMTESARRSINRVLKELRAVGATATDVRTRAEAYRRKFPGMPLTPTALMNHWDSLAEPTQRAPAKTATADEERRAREAYEADKRAFLEERGVRFDEDETEEGTG